MLCSKSCRQYVSVPELVFEDVPMYSDEEIREIEHEMLGVYLSSTPFDRLDPDDREDCRVSAETLVEGPDAVYLTAGLVVSVEERKTQTTGDKYANVTIETEGGTYRTSAFDLWRTPVRDEIKVGSLAIVEIKKKDPFYNLITYLGVT